MPLSAEYFKAFLNYKIMHAMRLSVNSLADLQLHCGLNYMPNLPSFPRPLPDSTAQTNDITAVTAKSRPYLSKSANGRRLCYPGGRATQVT